jgi:hypothetical protein
MATVGVVEFFVVEGLLADMAAFNAAVDAKIDEGFASVDEPQTDGTNIWLVMMKGSPASFVAEYEIVSLGSTLTSGSQELTVDPAVAGTDVPGVGGAGTDYDFTVSIDGAAAAHFTVNVAAADDYDDIAALMDTAIGGSGAAVTFAASAFVITSDSSGSTSTILVTRPTGGANPDLFAAIETADTVTITSEAPVAGTDDDDSTFEIEGNHILNFQAGYKFTVTRSTANDGVYTVAPGGSTFVTPNTVIPVNEVVADDTVDGYIEGWSPSVGP